MFVTKEKTKQLNHSETDALRIQMKIGIVTVHTRCWASNEANPKGNETKRVVDFCLKIGAHSLQKTQLKNKLKMLNVQWHAQKSNRQSELKWKCHIQMSTKRKRATDNKQNVFRHANSKFVSVIHRMVERTENEARKLNRLWWKSNEINSCLCPSHENEKL